MFYIILCVWRLKKAAQSSYGVWAVPSGCAWCNTWYEPVSYMVICHIPSCCQTGSISMTFLMCKTVPEWKCLRAVKLFAFQIFFTILTLSVGRVWYRRPSFIPLDFLRLVFFCSDFCHPSTHMRWFVVAGSTHLCAGFNLPCFWEMGFARARTLWESWGSLLSVYEGKVEKYLV